MTYDPELDRLIDSAEFARVAKLGKSTPHVLRYQKRGPAWISIGTSVRYRMRDVLAWIESRRRETSESQTAAV
ncbi:MAG: hypothetical protein RBU30_17655 [Polyangia bacterium]|jgi:predicted DNA-binding transcriptional regulator AlpA|nr:hypothetical protein [Polyangia bacterium]